MREPREDFLIVGDAKERLEALKKVSAKRVLTVKESEDLFILHWLLGSPPSEKVIADKIKNLYSALEKKKWRKPLNSREFNSQQMCALLIYGEPKRD